MSNTRNILLKLSDDDVKSVTFDIFDTVLLRKIHPEEMQFFEVAKQWVPLFHKVVSDKIEANELLSTRIYARKELWNINSKYNTREASDKDPLLSLYVYDVTLEEWFALIVDLFVEKYNKKINQEAKDNLVASMIYYIISESTSLMMALFLPTSVTSKQMAASSLICTIKRFSEILLISPRTYISATHALQTT